MEDLIPEICHEWKNYFESVPKCSIHHRPNINVQGSRLECCCISPCEYCIFHQPVDFSRLSQRLQYAIRFYPSICQITASSLISDPGWRLVIRNMPETIQQKFSTLIFNSETLGQLVSVSGVAVTVSEIVQLPAGMEFKCTKCGNIYFNKMEFPGILRFPSTQESDFENAPFSAPSDLHDEDAVSKWNLQIKLLIDSQRRTLHTDLGPFHRKALLYHSEDTAEKDDFHSIQNEPKCKCMDKKSPKGSHNKGKFIPLQHRSIYVDAQIIRVREESESELRSADNPKNRVKRHNNEKSDSNSTNQPSVTTASVIDVLVVGSHSVVPSLAPGTLVTVTGVLTVANAVADLLKRGGSLKRIGPNLSKSNIMPDIQHHPGDFTTGPKSVMLMSTYVTPLSVSPGVFDPTSTKCPPPSNALPSQTLTLQNQLGMERIPGMISHKNLEHVLMNAFCPRIFGHTNIKLAMLLCAVSGQSVQRGKAVKTSSWKAYHADDSVANNADAVHSPLHLLILGPAGIGKSQLLKFAANTLSRSVFVCGPTLTPSGLGVGWSAQNTAGVGSASNHARLEAGALIVADQGLCCIDEIDKMALPAQNVLHEVIDQGTLTVSKASVLHTVTTSAKVFAAGNMENVHLLSNELLSRFPLIFCISPNRESNTQDCAEKRPSSRSLLFSVLGARSGDSDAYNQYDTENGHLPKELQYADDNMIETLSAESLRAYLDYIRNKSKPSLSSDAKCVIKEWYLAERQITADTQHRVTPRHLNYLYEMACSLAKIRGKQETDADDVYTVIELFAGAGRNSLHNAQLQPSPSQKGGKQSKRMKKTAMADIFMEGIRRSCGDASKATMWTEAELREIYLRCFEDYLSADDANLTPFPKLLEVLNMNGLLLKASHSKYRLS